MAKKAVETVKVVDGAGRTIEVPKPPVKYRGGAVWSTKLTEEKVREIRVMHAAGWSINALADKYKTTWMTMSRIVKRESWRHVE